MTWDDLTFLADPAFVIPWYVVGAAGAAFVAQDLYRHNTPLKKAMKWAWPIVVFFFSVIGLALYFATARAPGVGRASSESEKKKLHDDYERNMFRRVNGAVIHCVAGDGLGIMSAMIIARLAGMTFWQEFWFEYAAGFAFGWLIFQYQGMKMMTDSTLQALAMAFRGEFFSMLTVMGGMGAVMTFVTPAVVGAQPQPLTYAFWGFGMFGLLIGYVFTFPMNWMLIKVGWKHGMGSKEGAHPSKNPLVRIGLALSMVVLGLLALGLPAWLTQERIGTPLGSGHSEVAGARDAHGSPRASLEAGLRESLDAARSGLSSGRRSQATNAIDAALRVAEVGAHAFPSGPFDVKVRRIGEIRMALQNGDARGARDRIEAALLDPTMPAQGIGAEAHPISDYIGVPVIDIHGMVVGEVTQAGGDWVELALGGQHDIWGFWDMARGRAVKVPVSTVVQGPLRTIGKSFAMVTRLVE